MKKSMQSIIEEQRELAGDLHEWDTSVSNMHPLSYLIVEFFHEDQERLRPLESRNLETIPELAAAIRQLVEREMVDSVWAGRGDLVWGFAFYALQDVDWEEVAVHVGKYLAGRAELMQAARKSGFLTLIQAADDLPKN